MKKTLKGTVRVGCVQGRDEQPMHIEVNDNLSRCRILDIYMSFEDFAKAISTREATATIEYYPNAPLGRREESKEETVPFDMFTGQTGEDIAAVLVAFEVDGWKARHGDMTNGHRRTTGGQRVVFFRHVPEAKGVEELP